MRCPRAALLATALLACAAARPARAESRPDSSLAFEWAALYRSRIDVSSMFPSPACDDEVDRGRGGDRLAVLGTFDPARGLSLFAKGATGSRLEGGYQDRRFMLDQAHIGFAYLGGALTGRFFSRERVYRTDQRLLKLLSDESRILVDRGEGIAVEADVGAHCSLQYIESILRDDVDIRGGLPSFRGGQDRLRVLRVEGFQNGRWHAGFTISHARVAGYGERITVGTDAGLRFGGIDCLAEIARTRSGGWGELRDAVPLDLNWSAVRIDDFGALFSETDAFAAELEGLRLEMGAFGSAGIVPGYRYTGNACASLEGEFTPGLIEGRVLAWWKPAGYDALVSIDAADGAQWGRDFSRLAGSVRTRFQGGFELRETILCADGERSSAAVSLTDDNAFSRFVMTARIDDMGAGNVVSWLSRGTINLGSRFAAKSALFLYRSRRSLYNVELEFRPRERFLFQASLGSFAPGDEGIEIERSFEPYAFAPRSEAGNRFVAFFTRVWFGSGGTR
jgi:hypothetical protein